MMNKKLGKRQKQVLFCVRENKLVKFLWISDFYTTPDGHILAPWRNKCLHASEMIKVAHNLLENGFIIKTDNGYIISEKGLSAISNITSYREIK